MGGLSTSFIRVVVAVMVLLASASSLPADDYYDIGNIHHAVTTQSDDAQTWFDRGLTMCFGFNHEEAVRCFERAIQADPGCVMAHWGIAYAWGPNINNMDIASDQMAQAYHAVHLAELLSDDCSDLERDLVNALKVRYAVPVPVDRGALNSAWSDEIRTVHGKHPDSALTTYLFAESLMNLQPWMHWDRT